MIERRYNKLLKKKSLSASELQELINYIYLLREQRENLVKQYQEAIDKIVSLEKRVEFYQSIHKMREV